uniref:Haloacid dehalogenase-like hydrolase domain-containing protein 1A n=1 Tax=Caligus rogercresseyi TaxID=217165 RepID=C1BN09_CALRO|nr:Haloacid dehalogenase-like hydrolase domain-containing protein 1A [Caligus rogercresseyi]
MSAVVETVVLYSSEEILERNAWISHYACMPEFASLEDPLKAVESHFNEKTVKDLSVEKDKLIFFYTKLQLDTKKWDVFMSRPSHRLFQRQLLEDLSETSLKSLAHKSIRFVIFDMDGLLINTEDIYTHAQEELLEPFEKTFTNEVKCLMMGRKALEGAQVLIEHYALQDKLSPQEFVDKRAEKVEKLFPTCRLLPGVKRLLEHLNNHSIPACVATGSGRKHFELKTQSHRDTFNKSFKHIVTSDEVAESKPHPEIFTLAASRFEGFDSNSPENMASVLVFEDSPLGIEAAQAAGFHSVLVETDYNKESIIVPSQWVSSLEKFVPELWGLPAFS